MADVDITSLSVEISAESQGAELNIDKLATAISNLRTKGNVTKVVNSLDRLAGSIATLKQASAGMSGLDKITSFLNGLSNVNPTASAKSINTVVNAIKKIPSAVSGLNGTDYYAMKDNIREVANGLSQLSILDAGNLKSVGSALNAFGKIPELTNKLDPKTLDAFAVACEKISTSLTPLASQLDKVGNAFAKLPPQLSKVVTQANRVTAANEKQRKSYLSLSNQMNGFMRNMAKLVSLKAIAEYLGNAVAKFNDFYEATDLFHNAMGNLSGEADTLISKMQGLLGVDPTKAMTYMATIQSLGTSFGLTSDKAYILSKNLTQLAYDESSYWNKNVAETFTAMSSAISGEIEPIRRLGVDLSQARLQQELLALGFNKQVSSLSQADKAVLRYIAIMKQTANVQGNLAQTIQSPANQIRILKAQLDMLAKSVGSLLYPALKAILPPLIAAVQLIREFVEWVAKLMDVKVVFTDFTKSTDSVGGIGDAMDNTADSTKKAAKALKDYTMGFDELNIIDPTQGSSGSGSGASAGNILGDVDLSGYDMFKDYVGNTVDEIKGKIEKLLPIIAGVAAGFAAWEISTALLTALETISTKGGLIKAIFAGINPVVAMITAAFALATARVVELWQNSEAFRKGIERVRDILKAIKDGFTNGFMSSFTDGKLGDAINHLKESFNNLKETIWNLLPESVQKAFSEFSKFVEKLNLDFTDLVVTIASLNSLNPVLLLFEAITVALRALGVVSDEDSVKMKTGLSGAFETVGKAVADAFGTVIDWFASAIDWFAKLPETAQKMVEDVSNWFAKLPENIAYHLGFVAGKIVAWAANMISVVATEGPKIPGKIVSFFVELPGKIYSKISGAYQTVVNWASGMKDKAEKTIPAVIDSFVSFFKEIPGKLKALGKDIVDGLFNGVKDAMSTVVGKVGELADSFVKGFKDALGIHSPSTVFHQLGVYIDQGLANGVTAGIGFVSTALQNLVNGTTVKGQEMIDHGYTQATGYVDNFLEGLDTQWQQIDQSLQNDFLGSIQTLGNALQNGDLQSLGKWAASYFYHAMNDEQRKQIASIAKNSLSWLKNGLSSVWQSIAGLASTYIGKLVPSTVAATTSQVGLNVAMDANPILFVISLIGMLVGALTGLSNKNSEVANKAAEVWSGFRNIMSYVFEGVVRLLGFFLQGFINGINIMIGAYNLVAKLWGGHIDYMKNPLYEYADKIADQRNTWNAAHSSAGSGNVNTDSNDKYNYTTDKSQYPGTSEYNEQKYSSSVSGVSSQTVNVKLDSNEVRDAVYNGIYNAFLDFKQRYADEDDSKTLKIYLDGKQITASVEKRQNDRGMSIMGTEAYSY